MSFTATSSDGGNSPRHLSDTFSGRSKLRTPKRPHRLCHHCPAVTGEVKSHLWNSSQGSCPAAISRIFQDGSIQSLQSGLHNKRHTPMHDCFGPRLGFPVTRGVGCEPDSPARDPRPLPPERLPSVLTVSRPEDGHPTSGQSLSLTPC
jgi:hypothetical protein